MKILLKKKFAKLEGYCINSQWRVCYGPFNDNSLLEAIFLTFQSRSQCGYNSSDLSSRAFHKISHFPLYIWMFNL